MIIQQLSVFVENKSGRVTSIVSALGNQGVDLSALSLADTVDFGIMRMIVDKMDTAVATLKEEGIVFKITDVLAVRLTDHPGGLAAALTVLSDANISVNYMYAFLSKEADTAMMVLSVPDPETASQLLLSKGFTGEHVTKSIAT